jgi:hypothetical protein
MVRLHPMVEESAANAAMQASRVAHAASLEMPWSLAHLPFFRRAIFERVPLNAQMTQIHGSELQRIAQIRPRLETAADSMNMYSFELILMLTIQPYTVTSSNVRWRTDSIVALRVACLESTFPLPVNGQFGSHCKSIRFAICWKSRTNQRSRKSQRPTSSTIE